MSRLVLVLVASVALAACCSEANMDGLRAKLGRKFNLRRNSPRAQQYYVGQPGAGHTHNHGGLVHQQHHHGAPGGGAAASSAAAASNGGSAAAAAAASATGAHEHAHQPHYARQHLPHVAHQPHYARRPVYTQQPYYQEPTAFVPAASEPMPVYQHHDGHLGGAASAAAAAASTGAAVSAPKAKYRFYQPPVHHQHNHAPQFFEEPVVHHHQVSHPPRFAHHGGHHGAGGAAAASSAAAAGMGAGAAAAGAAGAGAGAAAASAAAAATSAGHHHDQTVHVPVDSHYVDEENFDEHYDEPETANTFATATGTYVNNGDGHESNSYIKETEDVTNHEDGKESDNHYYNAQSYGKTLDEKKRERYNNFDEDIIHTPTVYRSKKSSTNYVSDLNKARRESGSGVLAKDRHSASYNKNSRRFNEKIDQRNHKGGAGVIDTTGFSSVNNFHDEDDEIYDSDGVGFVGVDGVAHGSAGAHGGYHGPRAATASSSVTGDAISTSAAVGQNAASSTSAASGHH